jgi:hypothetical protein
MTHTATPADLRHGTPVSTRSDRYGLDKHVFSVGPDWPDGLELFIYDDGRVKIGGWHTAVTVEAVRTFASTTGNDSRGGSHVIARFTAAMSAPDAVPELDGADAELRTYLISRARGANLGDPDAAKVTYGGAADAVPRRRVEIPPVHRHRPGAGPDQPVRARPRPAAAVSPGRP